MAKLIILEGLSRTGKTTISNLLKDEGLGRIVSIKDKRPENCDMNSFYKGVATISNEFYKAFPEETFILDRSFLSEIVYSKIFNRESSATQDYITDLIENNEVKLFYLYNSHEDYIKRSPKDRYVYTKEEYDDLWKFFLIECSKLPIQSFKIDTSKNDLKEVYNIITNLI